MSTPRDLLDMITRSSVVVVLVGNGDEVNPKQALQLGASVMQDKPIVALLQRGARVPEKMARCVDRFIELDKFPPDSQTMEEIAHTVRELIPGRER